MATVGDPPLFAPWNSAHMERQLTWESLRAAFYGEPIMRPEPAVIVHPRDYPHWKAYYEGEIDGNELLRRLGLGRAETPS